MSELRLARKTISILLKDRIHYPNRLILDTFIMIARFGVLIILYAYVFRLRGGTVNGAAFPAVAWSMFFYFAFMILNLRYVARGIMEDVQSGKVELLFSKPISYLWHKVWWQIGLGLYSFLVMAAVGTVALALIVGFPPTMGLGIFLPTFIISFVACCGLSVAVYLAVGLLAFWIEDVNPVFWIVDKFVMILGGSYLPVALFPPLMGKIATYSPFGASQFITHTTLSSWRADWPALVGIQLAWTAIFIAVILAVFAQARKKISVNGG